ncbi:hypothetical protein AMTRI_Chr04g185520 [Amborella trichopoda]
MANGWVYTSLKIGLVAFGYSVSRERNIPFGYSVFREEKHIFRFPWFSSLICKSRKIQSMWLNVMYMNWVQWFKHEKRKWGIHELQEKEDSRTLKSIWLGFPL